MAKKRTFSVGSSLGDDAGGSLLDEMIQDPWSQDSTVDMSATFSAPLAHVAPNPANPRTELGDISELTESMREKGQLQSGLVASRERFAETHPHHADAFGPEVRWVVIAGSRRRAAAEEAGLTDFKFTVSDPVSAGEALEDALIENVHREDLPPLDEAKALRQLVEIHGSQNKTAKRLGKSGAWVSQRLTLLNLTPELQDALSQRTLKVEDARRIGRLSAEEQVPAWEKLKQGSTNGVNTASDDAAAPAPEPPTDNDVNGRENATPHPSDPPNPTPIDNDVNAPNPPRVDPSPKEPPTGNGVNVPPQPEQLTLDLQWEPRTMAERLRDELGPERFSQLMEAGLELTG